MMAQSWPLGRQLGIKKNTFLTIFNKHCLKKSKSIFHKLHDTVPQIRLFRVYIKQYWHYQRVNTKYRKIVKSGETHKIVFCNIFNQNHNLKCLYTVMFEKALHKLRKSIQGWSKVIQSFWYFPTFPKTGAFPWYFSGTCHFHVMTQ